LRDRRAYRFGGDEFLDQPAVTMLLFWRALVPALWAIWLIYWLAAARGAKVTRRQESIRSRVSYQAPLILGAALFGVPHILGARLEQRFHPHTFGWFLAGAVLVAAGIGFSIAARAWLGGNWSGMVTLKQDHELIRSGPYALVRHPIYSGLLLALIGTAIVIGKWRALIGLALIVFALVRKITIEERFMMEAFGEAYARYRAEVPALVPFIA
jgi:protein-S-isoprenylcysteine O-methyltransferase Ste14